MIEIIKRERARHYHLQENLEKRQSEREARYRILRDMRNKAVAATYSIHARLAKYITLIRARWVEAEQELYRLANSSEGSFVLEKHTQKLISELLLYNTKRVSRIRDDIGRQMDRLRVRLQDLLSEIQPLMDLRRKEYEKVFQAKAKVAIRASHSEDSGFEVKPLDLEDLVDNYDRERHFLEFLGGSIEMTSYADNVRKMGTFSFDEHLDD